MGVTGRWAIVIIVGTSLRGNLAQECHSGGNMSEYHGRIELAESKESSSYDHWPHVASILLFRLTSDRGG